MHFNRTFGPLTVKGDLRALVAGIILLGLLINLGSWQLARATEKSALVDRWEARAALPAVHPKTLSTEPAERLADRQVTWRGLFQAEDYLLLDNRIHQGRVGYHVVALVSAEDVLVPVNLGWLAGDPSRRTEPTPVLPEGLVSVSGRDICADGHAAHDAKTRSTRIAARYGADPVLGRLAAVLVHADGSHRLPI